MKRLIIWLAISGSVSWAAFAGEAVAGGIAVSDAWSRETTKTAKAGGSYMMIVNDGTEADRLTGASTGQSTMAELHTHIRDGDVMRMREVEGGIEIPPGGSVMLEPGGFHIMLMGLNSPLVEGETFPLTLEFEKAGPIEVIVEIKDIKHGGGHKP